MMLLSPARSITRLYGAALALLASGILLQAPVCRAAAPAAQNSDTTEVKIYMNDGSDATGRLTDVTTDTLSLTTDKGPVTISRKKYQGMVLNNDAQIKMATLITTNPVVMADYGLFTQKSREKLNFALRKNMKTTCAADAQSKEIPVVHVQIAPGGNIKKVILLNGSKCPNVNQALMQNIKVVKMDPLPKDYPFNAHMFNYFYSPDSKTK